jgi:hypothetical protein
MWPRTRWICWTALVRTGVGVGSHLRLLKIVCTVVLAWLASASALRSFASMGIHATDQVLSMCAFPTAINPLPPSTLHESHCSLSHTHTPATKSICCPPAPPPTSLSCIDVRATRSTAAAAASAISPLLEENKNKTHSHVTDHYQVACRGLCIYMCRIKRPLGPAFVCHGPPYTANVYPMLIPVDLQLFQQRHYQRRAGTKSRMLLCVRVCICIYTCMCI